MTRHSLNLSILMVNVSMANCTRLITGLNFKRSSTHYRLNADGIPILDGSLGALTCRLVSAAVPLYDRAYLKALGVDEPPEAVIPKLQSGGVISELFVAEVLRVEESTALYEGQDDLQSLPLLYHRQAFTTILPPPTPLNPPADEE